MSRLPATNPWLSFPRPNERAALRLFCFPYAGGTAQIYHAWPRSLPEAVEVCAVQLPGRGSRISEPLFDRMAPLVEAAATQLLPYMDRHFAFFGHSMGAIIAFELARRLRREGRQQPEHLFISGRRAPQVPITSRPTYDLPEPEFIDELHRLNGTPREVLEHPEMRRLVMGVLRKDFEVVETYVFAPQPPLDLPFTVFGGLQDYETDRGLLDAWRELTTGRFALHMLPGDHFFLNTSQPALLKIISKELSLTTAGLGRRA